MKEVIKKLLRENLLNEISNGVYDIIKNKYPKARYEMLWYYGWDVASGCIWGPNMVNDSKLIQ